MKFQVTFKSPDALDDAIDDAVDHLSDQEGIEDAKHEMRTLGERFIKYGEYVTIEFDTNKSTCKVLEV